jgi:hypothetical protein
MKSVETVEIFDSNIRHLLAIRELTSLANTRLECSQPIDSQTGPTNGEKIMATAARPARAPRTYATNELPYDGAVCVVRNPPEHDPRGEHDDMIAIYWRGDWILRGNRCGEQVIAAERANFIIVRQTLSKDSIYAAVRKVDQMARQSPGPKVRAIKRAA